VVGERFFKSREEIDEKGMEIGDGIPGPNTLQWPEEPPSIHSIVGFLMEWSEKAYRR
jgi:hypothetical protein